MSFHHESDYTNEYWNNLVNTSNLPETTQSDIDNKTGAMQIATDNLVPKELDLSELMIILEEAEGYSAEDYTEESYYDLVELMAWEGIQLQSEVDELVGHIREAINNLELA